MTVVDGRAHPCSRPGVWPMSGIICSQSGHLIAGQMAKTPRHLCLPGSLASFFKAVQSKKAPLPMYLSEGGIASSTGAAQFIKALTRSVWRVVGKRTSLRLVQCTKVNSGISLIMVLPRSTLSSSRQLSHVRSNSYKVLWEGKCVDSRGAEAAGASSLVLTCSVDPQGDGTLLKVTSARLMHPMEEALPEIGFTIEHVCSPIRCMHPLQGTAFRKGFATKVATTRGLDTV